MVHLDLALGLLSLPNRIHEHVDGALARHLCVPKQHGNPQRHGGALLARLGVFVEGDKLAVQLGLAVQVGR